MIFIPSEKLLIYNAILPMYVIFLWTVDKQILKMKKI